MGDGWNDSYNRSESKVDWDAVARRNEKDKVDIAKLREELQDDQLVDDAIAHYETTWISNQSDKYKIITAYIAGKKAK